VAARLRAPHRGGSVIDHTRAKGMACEGIIHSSNEKADETFAVSNRLLTRGQLPFATLDLYSCAFHLPDARCGHPRGMPRRELIFSRDPTIGGSLKLIRITLSGNVEAYVNPDHVASIEAQGEQRTVVSLGNAKLLDIDEAVGKVAQILQGRVL
jgi:hypothetical protein